MGGLEFILRAIDTATLPLRIPDRIVKAGFDAFSELYQSKTGKDRFSLAQYASISTGVYFVGLGSALSFHSDVLTGLASMSAGLGLLGVLHPWASKMRSYSLSKGVEKVTDEGIESWLGLTRFMRFPFLIGGLTMTAIDIAAKAPASISLAIGELAVGVLSVSSYAYLIDSDTSRYETVKKFVGNLWQYKSAIAEGAGSLFSGSILLYKSAVYSVA